MARVILPLTTEQEIAASLEAAIVYRLHATLRVLQYTGERCVNEARRSQAYKDRTGNLRSSVGYVIAIDGKIVDQSGFDVVKKGKKGGKIGRSTAKAAVRQYPEGIVLVVVAGMNYAAHVAATGRDVIDSAELLAERLVPRMLAKLKLK